MSNARSRLIFAAFVAVLTITAPALAIPVTGELNIGGGSATVSATTLNFVCTPGLTTCGANTPGNFIVTPQATGSFAPYLGDTGFLLNISQINQPVGTPFLLQNFLTFNSAGTVQPPDIALDLTFIFPGVSGQAGCGGSGAVGQVCTPVIAGLGVSPFNLQNVPNGSTASFAVAGVARRISTGETSPFTGVFTSQFNVFYQSYLPTFATPGGSITNSFSATFAVPEPSSVTMLLGGLLLIGGLVRRKLD
jgi:hypothetical protein